MYVPYLQATACEPSDALAGGQTACPPPDPPPPVKMSAALIGLPALPPLLALAGRHLDGAGPGSADLHEQLVLR